MKVWVITGMLVFNLWIQSTFFSFLQIVGVKPDTLSMLVVSFALLAGSSTGALVGLFGGLMQDILYGGAVGYNALQYMLIGYVFGFVHERLYIGKVILPVFFVTTAVMLRGVFMSMYLFFTRADIPLHQGFAVIVIPEAVYTALLMPLLFYFMNNLYRKQFMTKKWQFKRT